ncbi:MAG TPA: hypothetical protein VFP54_06210 [Acidimicrobiales bacterium]|nr:hypothetical protein [Acidimicrobiales bacterium]
MSLGVEVSARDGSMVVVLSGTAQASALEGLQPALAAALDEGRVVVLDASTLTLVEPAGLESLLSGLEVGTGQLHVVGQEVAGGPGRMSGVSVTLHTTIEGAMAAVGRDSDLDGQPW